MLPIHPSAPQQFRQRNELLQKCLRPEPLPFPIEAEYPIVLAPEGSIYSYCVYEGEEICSHANLWPRRAINELGEEAFRLGLVGNVATDAALRGHGYMRSLLSTIEEEATSQGLAALVLWSDLDSFYHKLGFTSVGREYRFHYLRGSLPPCDIQPIHVGYSSYSDDFLANVLRLRLALPLTLGRNIEEFKRLLSIPWLKLYVSIKKDQPTAYALMGKGYDMVGVVHEWGAREPKELLKLLSYICQDSDLEQTMLLSPAGLSAHWRRTLAAVAALNEELPMALMRVIDPRHQSSLENLFVWGLDSI